MSAALATLINGEARELWPVHDRGLHYGDGLFETISCIDGRPRWLERHLARLARGCGRLALPAPDAAQLEAEVRSLLGDRRRAVIKIVLTRGVARARGYRPAGDEQPTRIVSVYEWPLTGFPEFRLGLSSVPLGLNPHLAGLKHLNRLEQVLAQREAGAGGWHEVVMCTGAGQVISGSMSNLFVLRADAWVTPPLEGCGVEGIMRSLVMEAAAHSGSAVEVAALAPHDLEGAPAMFVTNACWGVQPVHCYQERRLRVDERAARLGESIHAAWR